MGKAKQERLPVFEGEIPDGTALQVTGAASGALTRAMGISERCALLVIGHVSDVRHPEVVDSAGDKVGIVRRHQIKAERTYLLGPTDQDGLAALAERRAALVDGQLALPDTEAKDRIVAWLDALREDVEVLFQSAPDDLSGLDGG